MDAKKLIAQIGTLIDEKLEPVKKDLNGVKQDLGGVKQDVSGIKQQLDTVEMKVELVNKRVEQAQEETIDTLSELIHEGYNLHEKRIKKLEESLGSPQTQ